MSLASVRQGLGSAERLTRLSAFMCVLLAAAALAVLLTVIWVWLSPALLAGLLAPRLGLAPELVNTSACTRALGFLVSMLPTASLLFLLCQAYKLFDAFSEGMVFSAEAPRHLRRLGLAAVLFAILGPVGGMLIGLVLTYQNQPGQVVVALGFSGENLVIAALGGLIMAIGQVMVEANRLSEESKAII